MWGAALCLPLHVEKMYRRYNDLLDVEGIPTLAIFSPDGELITEEGACGVAVHTRASYPRPTAVGNVLEDTEGAAFPWVPPVVKNINSGSPQLFFANMFRLIFSSPSPPLVPFSPDDVVRPVNTEPCVCVMAEACDEPFQQQLIATLEPLCLDKSERVRRVLPPLSTMRLRFPTCTHFL